MLPVREPGGRARARAGRVGGPGGTKTTINSAASDFATRGDYDAMQSELELRGVKPRLRRAVPPGVRRGGRAVRRAVRRAGHAAERYAGDEGNPRGRRGSRGADRAGGGSRGAITSTSEGVFVRRRWERSIVVRKPSGSRPEAVEPEPRAAEPRDGGARRAHGALQVTATSRRPGRRPANGRNLAGPVSHAPEGSSPSVSPSRVKAPIDGADATTTTTTRSRSPRRRRPDADTDTDTDTDTAARGATRDDGRVATVRRRRRRLRFAPHADFASTTRPCPAGYVPGQLAAARAAAGAGLDVSQNASPRASMADARFSTPSRSSAGSSTRTRSARSRRRAIARGEGPPARRRRGERAGSREAGGRGP